MGTLLEKLRAYLSQATPEQLQKDWEDLKEWNEVGPLASEYIEACMASWKDSVIVFNNIIPNPEYSLDFSF